MATKPMLRVDINRRAYERIRTCADAFTITNGDLKGPILTEVAQVHRQQERRIFASEGGEGGQGIWASLSAAYKQRKGRLVGARRKILVFSGDMKERFIRPSRPEYVERFVALSKTEGVFELGARSKIAGFHFQEGIGLGVKQVRTSKPGTGKNRKQKPRTKPFIPKTFTWSLPRRDMVSKTAAQVAKMRQAIVDWYREERLPQITRICAQEARRSNNEFGRVA